MSQYNIDPENLTVKGKDNEFNLKNWVLRMIRLWPAFAVSLFTFFLLAYLYLKYTNPVHNSMTSIMVKDEKKGADLMSNSVFSEMGLGSNNKLVENEIEILKSYDLMDEVVQRLQIFVTIFHVGNIRDNELFDNQLPFSVEILNPEAIKLPRTWYVTDSVNGVFFRRHEDDTPRFIRYGDQMKLGSLRFRFMPTLGLSPDTIVDEAEHRVYRIEVNSPQEVAADYVEKISVEAVSKGATVINVSIKEQNRRKGEAILRSLISIYNQHGLMDKNLVTNNTIEFLNDRLLAVSRELQQVEGSVERFKSENRVTDLTTDAQQYIIAAQTIDAQKAQSQTQLNIIKALEQDLILNQEDPQLVPSTLGIQEPSLGIFIEKHNELLLQRQRIEQKSGPKNPLLLDMDQQLKELRGKLLSSVRNLKNAYVIAVQDVTNKDAQLTNRIRNVPLLERKLLQITRNQNVQEQLYAFLLQKREEAAVAGASNIEDSRTIIKPRTTGVVSPKKFQTWGLAGLFGLLLPVLIVAVRDFLNNKIGDAAQVEERTGVTLLGSVSHAKKVKSPIIINRTSRTGVAEQFRNIRTSIGYTGKGGKEVKTIMITSYQPGDGKSFVSLNMAAAFALLNKKTVILEFDLRKPAVSKALGIEGREGISSVLSGKRKVDDLLIEIPGNEGFLYLLPAGFIPPNPAELISGERMKEMIDRLKETFDIIIVDTPPFSLVTDASLLREYTDVTLLVLRQDHTDKAVYNELKTLTSTASVSPVYILLNDVGKNKRYQAGGYVYGKGYFVEDEA